MESFVHPLIVSLTPLNQWPIQSLTLEVNDFALYFIGEGIWLFIWGTRQVPKKKETSNRH